MSRVRYWREQTPRRCVMTPEGPVFAEKGEVVVVFVAEDANEALRALAALEKQGER